MPAVPVPARPRPRGSYPRVDTALGHSRPAPRRPAPLHPPARMETVWTAGGSGEGAPAALDDLSDDLLELVFAKVPAIERRLNLPLVCRRWAAVLGSRGGPCGAYDEVVVDFVYNSPAQGLSGEEDSARISPKRDPIWVVDDQAAFRKRGEPAGPATTSQRVSGPLLGASATGRPVSRRVENISFAQFVLTISLSPRKSHTLARDPPVFVPPTLDPAPPHRSSCYPTPPRPAARPQPPVRRRRGPPWTPRQ